MGTLYCLSNAPASDPFQSKLVSLAGEGDGVVLIEDAVYAAAAATTPLTAEVLQARTRGVQVWALKPDLDARGVCTDLPTVDYPGLVDLIVEHDRVVH
jgi:tRNA 2-thiouridine synthesizing protein B